jgi:hypothetical protein
VNGAADVTINKKGRATAPFLFVFAKHGVSAYG